MTFTSLHFPLALFWVYLLPYVQTILRFCNHGTPQYIRAVLSTLCHVCACLVNQSCLTLVNPWTVGLPGSSVHGDSPGKNTGVGCHALLQGIFPTQGLNSGLLHCGQILYCLSHQGSPRILEWVAYPFFRKTSGPRN